MTCVAIAGWSGHCQQSTADGRRQKDHNFDDDVAADPTLQIHVVARFQRPTQPQPFRLGSRKVRTNRNRLNYDRVNQKLICTEFSSRPWSHYGGDMTSEVDSSSSVSIVDASEPSRPEAPRGGSPTPSSTGSHSGSGHPLRRFRKSFSLRLSRRSSHDDANTTADVNLNACDFGQFKLPTNASDS